MTETTAWPEPYQNRAELYQVFPRPLEEGDQALIDVLSRISRPIGFGSRLERTRYPTGFQVDEDETWPGREVTRASMGGGRDKPHAWVRIQSDPAWDQSHINAGFSDGRGRAFDIVGNRVTVYGNYLQGSSSKEECYDRKQIQALKFEAAQIMAEVFEIERENDSENFWEWED